MMTLSAWAKRSSVTTASLLLLSSTSFGQADLVKSEGITGHLHRANLGKVVFMAKAAPAGELKEADFLKAVELKETGDLAFSAFMGTSLTNYLHRLAHGLSVDELTRNGCYQVSFFVDGVLIHKDNLHPAAIPADSKNKKTVFAVTL